jgi:hypothetical protein
MSRFLLKPLRVVVPLRAVLVRHRQEVFHNGLKEKGPPESLWAGPGPPSLWFVGVQSQLLSRYKLTTTLESGSPS